MKTETIDLFKLEENAENPRKITDSKADKLIDSILIFPRMLEIRPIVIDDTFKILGGNMRFKALQAIANMSTSEISANLSKCPGYNDKTELERDTLLNYWVHWINRPVVYVINASELSQKERKEFIIKDNTGFGEWDWSRLSTDWDLSELENWGVDLPAEWDVSPDGFGDDFSIPDGDKKPFQQMTFTFSDMEADLIKECIAIIKESSQFEEFDFGGNENANGNALYLIVKQWDAQKK